MVYVSKLNLVAWECLTRQELSLVPESNLMNIDMQQNFVISPYLPLKHNSFICSQNFYGNNRSVFEAIIVYYQNSLQICFLAEQSCQGWMVITPTI